MGFAADAARQQQWMHPGLMFPSSNARGRFDGYATGTAALASAPSSATYSCSSAPTGPSTPPTPDGPLITRNHASGPAAKRKRKPTDKTPSAPPALPPVYRLSSWPDFAKNHDVTGGGHEDDGHDHDNLLAVEPDRLGDRHLITTAGLDDRPDTFLELDKSSATPVSDDVNFFSSPPSEFSDGSDPETAVASDNADPKSRSMPGPTYMAVSARPLTAKEYQRYRSQRKGEASASVPASVLTPAPASAPKPRPRPTRSASDGRELSVVGGSRPRSGSEGCWGGFGMGGGFAGGETVAMRALGEKVAYRKPSSSPVFTTKEEFEALPPAIQRKCFSDLERLRLTQTPNVTIDSSQATNEFYDFSSTPLKLRRSKSHRLRVDSDVSATKPEPRPAHHPRTLSVDSAFRTQPSRIPGRRARPLLNRAAAKDKALSIIVDTPDESGDKPKTPASNESRSAPSSPTHANMNTSRPNMAGKERQSTVPESFFESFRFMEDADDLDLRLQLDTFNEAETPEETAAKRAKHRHPSFRKNFSISKISLNRSSQPPPSRPQTKDRSATPTSPPPTFSNPTSPIHGRRSSRALSLRTGRPSIAEGMAAPTPTPASPIDPDAAHYQDPEARLKLRVYLASPQKFDEAVEFGFPSAEAPPTKRKTQPHPLRKQQSTLDMADEPEAVSKALGATTADDKSSVYSDDGSMPEPDSPRTPEPHERAPQRAFRTVSETKPARHHAYSASRASSREMTLRMTLTRPDLRACDDQIYGWQQNGGAAGRRVQSPVPGDEAAPVVYVREGSTKDSIERQFAAMDAFAEPERGVVKRFWDKVRRQ